MPFGPTNASMTWCYVSDKVYDGLANFVKYVDDMVIHTLINSIKKHLISIEKFFIRSNNNNIKLNINKCKFFETQIKFAGNKYGKFLRLPDRKYINLIIKFKRPENYDELHSYLSMIGWIQKFLPRIKKLLYPLFDLLNQKGKKPFYWTKENNLLFYYINYVVDHHSILNDINIKKPFIIHCDASNKFYAGVLLQYKYDNNDNIMLDSDKEPILKCN